MTWVNGQFVCQDMDVSEPVLLASANTLGSGSLWVAVSVVFGDQRLMVNLSADDAERFGVWLVQSTALLRRDGEG